MLNAEVIFGDPHKALAERLTVLARDCRAAHIVTGFATVDGIRLLPSCLRSGNRLQTLVVGAGTRRAFDGLNELIENGVPRDRLYIHLGHSRPTKEGATYKFLRYHPMLHGKVYLFEYPDKRFAAVIGSHNVTHFALNGLNSEAAVLLTGPTSDKSYTSIVEHIDRCRREAGVYDPNNKEAYAWWLEQFADGLAAKAMDGPHEYEKRYTLVVFCQGHTAPHPGSELYLELPAHLYQRSLTVQVHGYVFDSLPTNAQVALSQTARARATFTGSLDGLIHKKGAVEILADWQLVGPNRVLTTAQKPFRPKAAGGVQQARVEVKRPISGTYIYALDRAPSWLPTFDKESRLKVDESDAAVLDELKLVPEEHFDWYRVAGLSPIAEEPNPQFEAATVEAATMFMLFSPRRVHLPKAG